MWAKEEIPDEDFLFLRVHKSLIRLDGTAAPRVFQCHGGGMSTNWSKYATPEKTRDEVSKWGKKPANYSVLALVAGEVRAIDGLEVEHTPDVENDNRAHTDVRGTGGDPPSGDEVRLRVKLGQLYSWVLHAHA